MCMCACVRVRNLVLIAYVSMGETFFSFKKRERGRRQSYSQIACLL